MVSDIRFIPPDGSTPPTGPGSAAPRPPSPPADWSPRGNADIAISLQHIAILPGSARQRNPTLAIALGPPGQAAVESAGLADLSPVKADGTYRADRLKAARDAMDGGKTPVAPSDAGAFETGIANAGRLSTTFRFQTELNRFGVAYGSPRGTVTERKQCPCENGASCERTCPMARVARNGTRVRQPGAAAAPSS